MSETITPAKKRKRPPTKYSQWLHDTQVCHWVEALLNDAFYSVPSYELKDYSLDLATLRRRGLSEGLPFYTNTLPRLMNEFLTHLESGTPSYSNFKLKTKGGIDMPAFLSGLFYEVLADTEESVVAFKALYQVLVCFKKLKGPYSEETLNEQEREFVAVDVSLGNLDFDNHFDDLVLYWARQFISEIFFNYEDDEVFRSLFQPRPGPGATNTPTYLPERYELKNYFNGVPDLLLFDSFFINYKEAHDEFRIDADKSDAVSRFKFVDKVVGKARGICIEENEMQFMQQGLKHLFYKVIEDHPITRGKVSFLDQSINGKLALNSSLTKRLATIDMSEASDRISRKLVDNLFTDLPRIREALNGLSTRKIQLPNLGMLETSKFAPMGSGICFPVMGITHWALIKSIIFLSMKPDHMIRDVYVYGDDIIIPSEVFDDVISILPRYGMKLNKTKSFVKSHFRESCGIHAYKGVDVTPVFFKYTPETSHLKALESLIAAEMQFFEKGFHITARKLRACDSLSAQVGHISLKESSAIGWKRPSIPFGNPKGWKKRYSKDLLSFQYRVKTFAQKESGSAISFRERDAYFRWLLQKASDHDDQWTIKQTKVKWAWLTEAELNGPTRDKWKLYDKTYVSTVSIKTPRVFGPNFGFTLV